MDQYVAPRIRSLERSSYCPLCRCGLRVCATRQIRQLYTGLGPDQALIWTCIEALLFF